eukprot:gene22829-29003_t
MRTRDSSLGFDAAQDANHSENPEIDQRFIEETLDNQKFRASQKADYARAILANYYLNTYAGEKILLCYAKASLKETFARNAYARLVKISVMDDLKEYSSNPYSTALEDWRQRLVCDQHVIDGIEEIKHEMASYSTVQLRTKYLFDLNRAKSILKSDQTAFRHAWPREPFTKPFVVTPVVTPRAVSPRGTMFPLFTALTASCGGGGGGGKTSPAENGTTPPAVPTRTSLSESTVVDDDPPLQRKPSINSKYNANTDRRVSKNFAVRCKSTGNVLDAEPCSFQYHSHLQEEEEGQNLW